MTKEEQYYNETASSINGGIIGKMFGCPCVKASNGKAAFCLYKDTIVIKLDKEEANEVMAFDRVKVFSPMDGRPMSGWYQIPYDYKEFWKKYAEKSFEFVSKLEANVKKEKKKKG